MTETSREDQIREYLNYDAAVDVTNYAAAILILDKMDDREREEMFSLLRGFFCVECGSTDPKCQCWNDE